MEYGNSIVDGSFVSGEFCKIGRFCIIEKGVRVGNNVKIGDFCKIVEGTEMGDDVTVGSYVRTGRNCRIGSGVMIKCMAVISPDVVVEDRVFIGPAAILLHQTPAGAHNPSQVLRDSFLSCGTYVAPGVTVGPDVIIGAGAVVTKNTGGPGTYVGVPAKRIK